MASESSDAQVDSYPIKGEVCLIGAGFLRGLHFFCFCMFQLDDLSSNFLCHQFLF